MIDWMQEERSRSHPIGKLSSGTLGHRISGQTPLDLSRSFKKLRTLGQTSAWLCVAKSEICMEQL